MRITENYKDEGIDKWGLETVAVRGSHRFGIWRGTEFKEKHL